MALSKYFPFAVAPGANAVSAGSYELLLDTVIALGFQPGTALSEHMNAVLRQLSVGVAGAARLATDYGGADMLDDGSVVNFRDGLRAAVLALAASVGVVPGTIVAYAGGSVPVGWLECNGSAIPRANTPALFAAIGTTYGPGDGATTFNLPDLRGEFLRGWDHGKGTDPGRSLGSTQADEIKSHTHTLPLDAGGASNQPSLIDTNNVDEGPYGAPNTGATGGSETRPRNVAVMYIIKI